MHAEVGELIHHDRSHRELRDASIYFYRWIYAFAVGHRLYGQLEEIPLPSFNSLSWPLPDMSTSESFRAKMRLHIRLAMKPNTGSRRSHVQWFMPLTVFIDLFASAVNRVRSPTLFTIRNLEAGSFDDLMDKGWNQKVTEAGDIIRCSVNLPSVVFRCVSSTIP